MGLLSGGWLRAADPETEQHSAMKTQHDGLPVSGAIFLSYSARHVG